MNGPLYKSKVFWVLVLLVVVLEVSRIIIYGVPENYW